MLLVCLAVAGTATLFRLVLSAVACLVHADFLLIKIKQRLRLDYRHLVGIRREAVNLQLILSRLEINVAEWL
jgi:hypothetical protein